MLHPDSLGGCAVELRLSLTPATESPQDFGSSAAGKAERWISEIQYAERFQKDWLEKCRKILKRYRDDRGIDNQDDRRKFNLLWSNVQTLGPAIYAQAPKTVVERRYLDDDAIARVACIILERSVQTNITEKDQFHTAAKQCRFDYLTAGRGALWLRYEPHTRKQTPKGPATAPDPQKNTPADGGVQIVNDGTSEMQELAWEEVCADYVHYTDFLMSPARWWEEVRWVGRKVYMTRDEMKKRFKGVPVDEIPLDASPEAEAGKTEKDELFKRACIVEVWDKTDRKVIWVAPSYKDRVLDEKDDPLGLTDFFPCPMPVLATLTNDSVLPIPDYELYQDQAEMLDELTNRISLLTRACKVAGVYNEANSGIQRLMNENTENELIPIAEWGSFSERGGLKGSVDFMPIDVIAKVLAELSQVREGVKQDAYEITGMSDILRGATNPEETATAQNIKSHFATLRLSDRQQEMARFVRDAIRIVAEIIARHFAPETMLKMSNYGQVTDANPQAAMAAIQLIKDNADRGFRIDIETDSTIASDQQQDQQARVQFMQALGGFLQQSLPLVQSYPDLAPMLGKMILFGVRGFPIGRELETSLEEAINQLEAAAKAGQQPQAQGGQQQPETTPGTPQHAAATHGAAAAQAKAAQEAAKAQQAQVEAQAAPQQAGLQQQLQQIQIANYQSQIKEREAKLEMSAQQHETELQLKIGAERRAEEQHQQQLQLNSAKALAAEPAAKAA